MSEKPFATVKACLDAGHTWEECVGLTVKDGKFEAVIKKDCPACMRRELSDMALSGKGVNFSLEPVAEVIAETKGKNKDSVDALRKKYKDSGGCATGNCGNR